MISNTAHLCALWRAKYTYLPGRPQNPPITLKAKT